MIHQHLITSSFPGSRLDKNKQDNSLYFKLVQYVENERNGNINRT